MEGKLLPPILGGKELLIFKCFGIFGITKISAFFKCLSRENILSDNRNIDEFVKSTIIANGGVWIKAGKAHFVFRD